MKQAYVLRNLVTKRLYRAEAADGTMKAQVFYDKMAAKELRKELNGFKDGKEVFEKGWRVSKA